MLIAYAHPCCARDSYRNVKLRRAKQACILRNLVAPIFFFFFWGGGGEVGIDNFLFQFSSDYEKINKK